MGQIESALEEEGQLDEAEPETETEPEAEVEEETPEPEEEPVEVVDEEPADDEEGEEDADEKDEDVEIDENQMFVLKDDDGNETKVSMKELQESYRRSSLVSRWQKQAQATLTKAEQKEAELRRVLQNWMEDPFGILEQAYGAQAKDENMGIRRVRELTTEYLRKALEEEEMSPEQRQFLQEKRAWERQKREDEARRRREEEQTKSTLQQQYETQLSKDIAAARTATGLPDLPEVNEEIASTMLLAMEANQELTAKEAAAIVRQDRQAKLAKLMNSADYEKLAEEFPEASAKVSSAIAKRMAKKKAAPKGQRSNPSQTRQQGKEPKFHSANDWRQALWEEL